MATEIGRLDRQTKLIERERELAANLRKCCSFFGVERQSRLKESASLLLDMGSLYIEKARHYDGMVQKLTFIKSAALICGARVRFQKYLSDVAKGRECEKVYRDMSSALLTASDASVRDADLLDISRKVSTLLKQIRKKEKEFIQQKLAPIADEVSASELIVKQKERIPLLGTLLKDNTAHYRAIMNYVSKKCVEVLGDPPCQFCVVGLGSLAREEVTLYSDFEHIILLEDEIDDSDGGKIREYFRWFSVLFHVIVIGLSETYIPTVGVESLNDLYSEDKSKNWYFDLYTPGGVSFDGRFPHSCKTPLGKQEPSIKRKDVVELIQPAEKMLKYLTSEEDRKNGYHLRDILIRTCLVYGDKDLYMDFRRRSASVIVKPTRDQEVLEQAEFVAKNVNWLLSGTDFSLQIMDFEKIKDFLYRPITVLVGCLSRICRRIVGSNIGFFGWFRDKMGEKLASDLDEYLHNLEYAVSVACEVRLKVYAFAGKQKQKMTPEKVSKFVSKRCLIGSLRAVQMAVVIFRAVWTAKVGYYKFFELFGNMAVREFPKSVALIEADFYKMFGYHEDSLSSYLRLGPEEKPHPNKYLQAGLQSEKRRDEYFQKAEEIYLARVNSEELSAEDATTMSHIYFLQGRYDLVFDLLEKWTTKYRNEGKPLDKREYIIFQLEKSAVLQYVMTTEDGLEYSKSELQKNADIASQIAFRCSQVIALLRLGEFDCARKILSEVSRLWQEMTHKVPQDYLRSMVQLIFQVQVAHEWEEDANETLDFLDRLQGTRERNFLDDALPLAVTNDDGNFRNTKAAIQLYKQDTPDDPASLKLYGNLLADLLLRTGISNLLNIIDYFEDVPGEAIHQPLMYKDLHIVLRRYWQKIDDVPCHRLGDDFLLLLENFSDHFLNPLFIGPLMDIMTFFLEKYSNLMTHLKSVARQHESKAETSSSLAYNAALKQYSLPDIQQSILLFWKLLHYKPATLTLKNKSCKFLAHMLSLVPFEILIDFLPKHRTKLMKKLYFPETSCQTILYNETVEKYVLMDFEASATGFWRIALKSSIGSLLRQRSIEMMMFTIVLKWERNGFWLNISNDVVCL